MKRPKQEHNAASLSVEDQVSLLIAEAMANGDIPPEELGDIIEEATASALHETTAAMFRWVKKSAPKMLREQRESHAGFERRNYQRWRKAFEMFEIMWSISEGAGSKFNETYRPEASEAKDYAFEALTYLHARSLLVAREIMCLLYGGFPDGALGRWRTMHEMAVTATFIKEHGNEIAHRYLASRYFNSYRAAKQVEGYAERSKIDPFPPEEVNEMKRYCDAFAERFGDEMWNQYGWAAPALKVARPDFSMIEKAVGLDHWRPRFKWASEHTHAPHRAHHSLLGVTESKQPLILVGPSNSGMIDPLQMAAITLCLVTNALLTVRPSFDHVIAMSILNDLSTEIGPLATKLEIQSKERNAKRAKAKKKQPKRKK